MELHANIGDDESEKRTIINLIYVDNQVLLTNMKIYDKDDLNWLVPHPQTDLDELVMH